MFDSRILAALARLTNIAYEIFLQLLEANQTLSHIERSLIPRTTHAQILFSAPEAPITQNPQTPTLANPHSGETHTMANPGSQAVGSKLLATFTPIEADGVTVTPGTTITTQPTWSIDNTAIATLVDNGNGTATITGVSAGTVTITASNGTFTDSDGTVVGPLSATNSDTVTAPTGRTVSAAITFS